MRMFHAVRPAFAAVRQACRQWGPYLMIELVLPGGTLIALLMYVHQRIRAGAG